MEAPADWLLWQLADSAFPSGGFAHSSGLEATWQLGELPSLSHFIRESLEQAGHSTLPFVTAAYDAPASLEAITRQCDATLPNHVTNRASRAQGGALLASAVSAFEIGNLRELRRDARERELPLHYAPIFGLIASKLGAEKLSTQRLWLFMHLRGLISSAVRLSLVGPLEGQSLQHRLSGFAEDVLSRCQTLSLDDVTQTNPLLDLFQGHHDRLYSRLFSS